MLLRLRVTSALLLSLALSASAGVIARRPSPMKLSLTKHYNLTGTPKLLELDQARAKGLIERAKIGASESQLAGTSDVPLVSQAVFYSATVGFGDPPRNYELLVDTGSSNTWVGAQFLSKPFLPTTSRIDGDLVLIPYGSGLYLGLELTDTVHIGDLSIANQGFGAAAITVGMQGFDGILGIGPADLTCGSLIPNRSKCVPTVTDNAFKQRLIDAPVVGISFVPTTNPGDANGELTFGGTDLSKANGPITYVPITTTDPASYYVGINQTISYGDTTILLNGAGITDTGTTLILLATDAFNQYKNLTGAVADNNTGLLRVTPQQFSNLQSMIFTIGGTPFELIPNAQAWPRRFNSLIGGSPDYVYLIVGNLGNIAGGAIAFINGMSFLERFYHVYDSANKLAGFAPTSHTYALKSIRRTRPSNANDELTFNDVLLANRAGITDTGTMLLLLATDAFDKYKNLTGAEMDIKTGFLKVTPGQFGALQPLLFTIGPATFVFTPNAQAWPRQLNQAIGGSLDDVYLIVSDLGSIGGEGFDFINGMSFPQRFYHVYDTAKNRVGFAETEYTYAVTN